jgi:hypothetical protein
MTHTTVTTTSADDQSQSAKDAGRCTFRYANQGRCRRPAQSLHSNLCSQHSSAMELHDTDDLSGILFDELPEGELPGLQTPEEVSTFLARVVVLLAEGRISPRRATVFTYAASLLLRSAIVIDRDTPTQIIYDLPHQHPTHDHELSQPEAPSPILTGGTR